MITIRIGRTGLEFTVEHGGVYLRVLGWEAFWSPEEGLRAG